MTLTPEDLEALAGAPPRRTQPGPKRALGLAQALEVAPKRLDSLKLSRETQVPWELVEENTEEVRAARAYEMLGPYRA